MNLVSPILESELRAAVRRLLSSGLDGQLKVYEELRVERGSSRIDFATVGPRLEGFELKSDLDSYARMHGQIHAYNRSFERITLVAGEKFTAGGERLLPAWWGIIEAYRADDGLVQLRQKRAAADNPLQDPHSVAALLGEQEAIDVLANESISARRRSSRVELHELIATSVPFARLRQLVNESIALRPVTTLAG